MIPERLEDWTYEVIKGLVDRNRFESDRHDFKGDFPDALGLTKTCCAFANTKGGFLIFGVGQKDRGFRIVGIDNDKELAHRFGQKTEGGQPTIDFDLPRIIEIPNSPKVLAVFHIPIGSERPHIPSQKNQRIFWKRTNKGNEQMSLREIRISFLHYEERREKLKLLYLELVVNAEKCSTMKIADDSKSKEFSLTRLDSTVIKSLLIDLYTYIGKHKRLIKTLFQIREIIDVMNTKTQYFLSQMSVPITNRGQLTKKHNDFIEQQIEELAPLMLSALKILEEEFGLKNPLS